MSGLSLTKLSFVEQPDELLEREGQCAHENESLREEGDAPGDDEHVEDAVLQHLAEEVKVPGRGEDDGELLERRRGQCANLQEGLAEGHAP